MSALLIDLTVRGSVAFFLVWGADVLLAAHMQARWRRLWWVLVPLVFLLPWKAPVLPAPAPGGLMAPFLSAAPAEAGFPAESVGGGESPLAPARWIVAAWLAGVTGSAAVLLVRTLRASRRWKDLRFSTDARLLGVLEDGKMRAGITAPIGLVVAGEVETPAIVGWLRPRILLPGKFAASASDEQLRHVLLHELAHFRALDVPAGWLFAVARCVHWFNPAAHLAAARWADFREEAADENAIRWSRQSGSAA